MIELLKNIDTRLFLFFNAHHTPFMDSVMSFAGNKFTWIPLYLLFLFFVWKKAKNKMWLVVLSVVILITLSDQISVHLFKKTFQRCRPCHNLLLQDKIQLINGECGGIYGFVSSHAANTFALITFLSLFFRRKDFALCMYLWASIVSYSRVYAGVHYPFDILGGMMLGIFLGVTGYKSYIHLDKKYAH
ncbi:MAG: phosphatase PAP2 family protein [Bacteroidetes bacterium]|nr:phosphatase PAP2 family protein [Bacteroidota bacterium]